MCCCRPQFIVTSVISAAGIVTLTANRALDAVGDESPFQLCIMKEQIPAADTGRIVLTDGTLTFDCYTCGGQYLRADSLRRFICRNGSGCCCTFDFNCCRGDDPVLVQFQHRFCGSAFDGLVVVSELSGS